MPKTPSPKPGIKVALSKGVTMDAKTGVRTTKSPTPKPMKTKSNKDYFADQRKFVNSRTTSK